MRNSSLASPSGLASLSLVAPDPAPAYERFELPNLFQIADWSDRIAWRPFQDGVDICRLHGDGRTGPTTALIRFRQASKIPLHQHTGAEHILILAGSQRDQNTSAAAGTLMINPAGSAHSVVGEAGCIVLAIYERPVEFLQDAPYGALVAASA